MTKIARRLPDPSHDFPRPDNEPASDSRATGCAYESSVVPGAVTPAIDGVTPSRAWAIEAGDHWALERVSGLAKLGTTWAQAVAVATLARLCEPASLEGLTLAAPWLSGPRRWMRALGCDATGWIEAHAVAEAQRLRRTLSRDPQRNRPPSTETWLRRCRARDDLQSVAVLLHEVERRAIDEELAAVDSLGSRRAMPRPPRSDEQLRRAAARDQGAWWVGGRKLGRPV